MTALVTGASGGIGLELARLLARDGSALVLAARSGERLLEVKLELERDFGVPVTVFAMDLSAPGAAERLFALTEGSGTEIDVLANNAGFGSNGPFLSASLERQREMVQLNVTALMDSCRLFGAAMRERGRGRILNISSCAAFCPGPYMSVYYATKAFVLSFSQALFEELRGSGVTVTALCPGPTRSGFESAARMTGSKAFSLFPLARADSVARAGYRALMRGRPVRYHSPATRLIELGSRLLPRGLLRRVSGSLNGVPAAR